MEIEFLKAVHATFHSQTWLNYLMTGFTWLGEFGAASILTAVVLLIFKKTRWAGVSVALAVALDVVIVNLILKNTVNRPRPWSEWGEIADFYASAGVRKPTDTSFPSGHTAVCFAAAVALTFRYRLKALPALIISLIVAVSRIYLCVHYPTDVLGGIIIGVACGVAGYYFSRWIEKKFKNRKNAEKEK